MFDFQSSHLSRSQGKQVTQKRLFLCLATFALVLFFNTHPALAQEAGGGFNLLTWFQDAFAWIQTQFRDALTWIQDLGIVGVITFIGLYIVATVAFLPGSILTLGAGVVFGIVAGSIYVFIAATFGATAAFLVGRYLARGWVAEKIRGNPKFAAIDKAVATEGLKIVLLTRLSPILPFNLLNYAFAITGVSLKDYVVGSVGMIPGTIMYVYLGSLASNLALIGTEAQPSNPTVEWIIRILGLVTIVAVTIYVTRLARQALNEEVLEEQKN